MTGGVVLSAAVGGRRSRSVSGARLGRLAGLGCATAFACWAGRLAGRAVCGRKQQAGSGGWQAVLLLLLPAWARSRGAKLGWFGYSGQMPLFFSSVFFSFSISYFYPTLCHGFLTLEYMCCQHVYLLVWSSRGHLRL